MPQIALSDASLRSFKPPLKGTVDFWDTNLPGFGCRVSQGGAKTFVLKLHNSRRAIGRYPLISLSEARTEAKRLLAEKTLGKVRPQSKSYPAAVQEFLEEKATRRRARTVADHKRHLNLLGFKGPLANIGQSDLSRKLKPLSRSEFNHRLSCARTFFTWARRKRYITENPADGFTKHTIASRKRVLTDDELKAVWRAAEHVGGPFGSIVRLLILTGQRRGEIAALRCGYYSHNEQTIFLPGELTKNRRDHLFPIGPLSTGILSPLVENIRATDRDESSSATLLFPAQGKSEKPINSWSQCKRELDEVANKFTKIAPWTLHDLRRTFSTNLGDLGVTPHVGERLINHVTGTISGVSAIYNRAAYLPEMREAVRLWEEKLISLLKVENEQLSLF